jgi:hypothetical protein
MNDGFRTALKEIAAQDVTEVALDPGWPRRIAEAALAALPAGLTPDHPHLDKARDELVATVQGAHRRTAKELVAALERFIDAKLDAGPDLGGYDPTWSPPYYRNG